MDNQLEELILKSEDFTYDFSVLIEGYLKDEKINSDSEMGALIFALIDQLAKSLAFVDRYSRNDKKFKSLKKQYTRLLEKLIDQYRNKVKEVFKN